MYFIDIEYFVDIMLYYVVWGSFCACLSILVTILRILTKIHQNQFFIYFYGFKLLVLYNLVLYLYPVLVIWHNFNHFLSKSSIFPKLKKVSFGRSKLGYIKLGKTWSSHFMLI